MRSTKLGTVAIITAAFSLLLCGESGSTPLDTAPYSLVVSFLTKVDTVPENTSRQLAVRVTNSSGVKQSAAIEWLSLDPTVAAVSGGQVSALAPGSARVVARVGAASDTFGYRHA
jgi:hypothetical protein